jgi:hypothetical protein
MDFLIDPYRFAPVLPLCAEVLVMVKQTQGFGGAIVGDGMPQTGPAVTARAAFLAALQNYATADLNHVTASTSTSYTTTALPLWGGFGQLNGAEFFTSRVVNNVVSGANGRFNTTANESGNWYETNADFNITLAAPKTAFGCYVTDMGDFREGEGEFRFYLGGALVRNIQLPVVFADKPRSNEAMWVGFADGGISFDRIEFINWQHSVNPSQRDFFGFDDFLIGDCLTCVPTASATVHYGANTEADTAKTATGAALTARTAFAAATTGLQVCDFESMTVGAVGPAAAITFGGGVTGTITCNQYSSDHTTVAASTTDIIDNSGASNRWNTTSGGSKWYEFTDEVVIALSAPVTAIGFYVTDLGNHNATLRVTLRRANGSAVAYYLPKAAALAGASGLLRFWGVTGETQFTQVILQTVYYADLTPGVYDNPVFHVQGTPEIVGIDDILIGN